jgi:hypothetical protein
VLRAEPEQPSPLPELNDPPEVKELPPGFEIVMYQAECDPDGEGWCQVRDCDPTECDCIGPTEDNVSYILYGGVLYGRRLESPEP